MPYKDKNKQREFGRLWIAKRRHDYFKDKACVSCGILEKLELDHIDPATKISHIIWSWRKERRLEEIKKCQILCQKCHRLKTNEQLTKPLIHGTSNAYRKKRCRCDKCREFRKLEERKYRHRFHIGRKAK